MGRDKNDFDSSSYVKVNERIMEFREKYPNGRITTFRTDTETGVSFRTVVCKDQNDAAEFALTGLAPSTGHSFLPYELAGDKVEEFSETVSVGRALALLGFKVEKGIASSEEMVRWNENKHKQTATPPPVVAATGEGASDTPADLPPKLKASNRFKMSKITKEGAE